MEIVFSYNVHTTLRRKDMRAIMVVAMLFVSLFVLTSFVSADEVSKVQIIRTTTLQYELSEIIHPYERQQLLKYTILAMLEKNGVHGVDVSVGEKSVTLLVKESNGIFSVHNFCVLRSIFDVLGKKPELLK